MTNATTIEPTLVKVSGIDDGWPIRRPCLKRDGSCKPLRAIRFLLNSHHRAFAMQLHGAATRFRRGQVHVHIEMNASLGYDRCIDEKPCVADVSNRPVPFL
jgi:hypothetical protein